MSSNDEEINYLRFLLYKLEKDHQTELEQNHLNKLIQWCRNFIKQSNLMIFLCDRNKSCYYDYCCLTSSSSNGPHNLNSKHKDFAHQISVYGKFIDTLYDDSNFIIYAVSRKNYIGKRYEIMNSIKKYVCE